MEDFSKTYSTSASRARVASNWVNSSSNKVSVRQSAMENYNLQPLKVQSQSNYFEYSKLNSLTINLSSELQQLRQHNKLCLSNAEFDHSNIQNISEYSNLSADNIEVQKQLKMSINKKINKFDQQILEIYRSRTVEEKRNANQVKQNLEQLMALKDKCIEATNKSKSRIYESLRQKVGGLGRDTIEFNKQNLCFRGQIFGKLNSLRSRLMMQVSEEEKRRKKYNEIIHNLLEKSCEKAQQMLRRKL